VGEARPASLCLTYVPELVYALVPRRPPRGDPARPDAVVFSHRWQRVCQDVEADSFRSALEAHFRLEAGLGFDGEEGERRWRNGLVPDSGTSRRSKYLDTGSGAEQIRRCRVLFPAERLKVVRFEDLCGDPAGVTGGVQELLGLAPRPAAAEALQKVAFTRAGLRSADLALSTGSTGWCPRRCASGSGRCSCGWVIVRARTRPVCAG
jgi:hypothetical protein